MRLPDTLKSPNMDDVALVRRRIAGRPRQRDWTRSLAGGPPYCDFMQNKHMKLRDGDTIEPEIPSKCRPGAPLGNTHARKHGRTTAKAIARRKLYADLRRRVRLGVEIMRRLNAGDD